MADIDEILKLKDVLEQTAKRYTLATGKAMSFEEIQKRGGGTLQGVVREYHKLEEAIKGNTSAFQKFDNLLVKTAVGLETFVGAARAVRSSLDYVANAYGESFNAATSYQQGLAKLTVVNSAYSKSLGTVSQAQKFFSDTISEISKQSRLATPQAQKVFDTMMSGFRGLRTENAIKGIRDLTVSVNDLYLTAEDTERALNKISDAYFRYQEVQDALQGRRELTQGDIAGLFAAGESRETVQEIAQVYTFNQMNPQERAGFDATRQEAIQFAELQQSRSQREFNVQMATVQTEFVDALANFGESLNDAAGDIDSVWGKVTVAANTLAPALAGLANTARNAAILSKADDVLGASGSVLGGIGNTLKNLAIGGAGIFAGKKTGALGKVGGAVGGVASLAAMKDTVPVMVMGFGPLARGGFGGMGGLGFPTPKNMSPIPPKGAAGRVAQQAAKRGLVGRVAGIGASGAGMLAKGGMYGLIATGLASLAEQGIVDPIRAFLSEERTLRGEWEKGTFITGLIDSTAIGREIGDVTGGILYKSFASIKGLFTGEKAQKLDAQGIDRSKLGAATLAKLDAGEIQIDDQGLIKARTEAEKLKEAYEGSLDALLAIEAQTEENVRKTELSLRVANKLAEGYSKIGSALSKNIGFADVQAKYGVMQANQMEVVADKIRQQISAYREAISVQRQIYDQASASGDTDAAEQAFAEMSNLRARIIDQEAEMVSVQVGRFETMVNAVSRPYEAEIELQKQQIEISRVQMDLAKAGRLGIGVDYQLRVKNVEALMQQVKIQEQLANKQRQYANQLREEAKIDRAQGNVEDAEMKERASIEVLKRANDAQIAADNARRDALESAKAMREGYLDAMEATVAGMGAFAKILPQQGFGNQFFAATPSFGMALEQYGQTQGGVQRPGRYGLGGIEHVGQYGQEAQQTIEQIFATHMGPAISNVMNLVTDEISEALYMTQGQGTATRYQLQQTGQIYGGPDNDRYSQLNRGMVPDRGVTVGQQPPAPDITSPATSTPMPEAPAPTRQEAVQDATGAIAPEIPQPQVSVTTPNIDLNLDEVVVKLSALMDINNTLKSILAINTGIYYLAKDILSKGVGIGDEPSKEVLDIQKFADAIKDSLTLSISPEAEKSETVVKVEQVERVERSETKTVVNEGGENVSPPPTPETVVNETIAPIQVLEPEYTEETTSRGTRRVRNIPNDDDATSTTQRIEPRYVEEMTSRGTRRVRDFTRDDDTPTDVVTNQVEAPMFNFDSLIAGFGTFKETFSTMMADASAQMAEIEKQKQIDSVVASYGPDYQRAAQKKERIEEELQSLQDALKNPEITPAESQRVQGDISVNIGELASINRILGEIESNQREMRSGDININVPQQAPIQEQLPPEVNVVTQQQQPIEVRERTERIERIQEVNPNLTIPTVEPVSFDPLEIERGDPLRVAQPDPFTIESVGNIGVDMPDRNLGVDMPEMGSLGFDLSQIPNAVPLKFDGIPNLNVEDKTFGIEEPMLGPLRVGPMDNLGVDMPTNPIPIEQPFIGGQKTRETFEDANLAEMLKQLDAIQNDKYSERNAMLSNNVEFDQGSFDQQMSFIEDSKKFLSSFLTGDEKKQREKYVLEQRDYNESLENMYSKAFQSSGRQEMTDNQQFRFDEISRKAEMFAQEYQDYNAERFSNFGEVTTPPVTHESNSYVDIRVGVDQNGQIYITDGATGKSGTSLTIQAGSRAKQPLS